MANTVLYKSHVEPFVRAELERIHGRAFSSQTLQLITGGTHEFDAVSEDGSIVTSIKSLSGKTAGGNRPAAKYSTCLAELYFLSLVESPRRILVLTTPDWHTMFVRYMKDRLAPGLEIELIKLSDDLQAQVDRVKDLASGEVSPLPQGDDGKVDSSSRGDTYSEKDGCRQEILDAARHFHSLGQADFSPDEMLSYLHDRGTVYEDSTIRTHVCSVMCANAPENHLTTYDDLERVGRARYRLINSVPD